MASHRQISNALALEKAWRKINHAAKKKLKRIARQQELQYEQLYIAAQHNYDGQTLNSNLIKHASAPVIPTVKHPNPKYNLPRIKITTFDDQLTQLMDSIQKNRKTLKKLTPSEIIDQISPADIKCNCPHKHKFTKILETDVGAEPEAMVWTACRHTTFAAAKRQMKAAPTPDPTVADDFFNHSKQIIDQELGDTLTHFGYSVTDWYNHLSTVKQKALQPAIDYYNGNILNIKHRDLQNIKNKHYTGILKEELQPLDGKPRMVCSIPQSTKYIMGPVTWQLEEHFSDHLQGYCGGKNLDEMADDINKYLKQGFTKIVEGDGSAFDNTQDVSLKAVDRYIYQKIRHAIYHVPLEEYDEATQALYKTMDIDYIDGKKKKHLMSYTILGTVFSGDCDTTLMNTTRMALYNRYVNDKAGWVFGKDYICFAKGDDFTVMYKPYITNQQITDAYYRYFLPSNPDPSKPDTRIFGLGQVLKMLEFGDASILKFCSLRAWFTNASETQIYLTRDPTKFFTISKYSRKAKQKSAAYVHDYLLAQAQALKATYTGIRYFTIMAAVYEKQAQLIKQQYPKGKYNKLTKQFTQIIIKTMNHPDDPNILQFDQMEENYFSEVAHRHFQYKIQTNYWETMQLIEKAHIKTLTKEQADYISLQIESEFMVEYLKSMIPSHLGPK